MDHLGLLKLSPSNSQWNVIIWKNLPPSRQPVLQSTLDNLPWNFPSLLLSFDWFEEFFSWERQISVPNLLQKSVLFFSLAVSVNYYLLAKHCRFYFLQVNPITEYKNWDQFSPCFRGQIPSFILFVETLMTCVLKKAFILPC